MFESCESPQTAFEIRVALRDQGRRHFARPLRGQAKLVEFVDVVCTVAIADADDCVDEVEGPEVDHALFRAPQHIHGSSAEGDEVLSAYQVEGYSRSGESAGWKMFRLDRMSGLMITIQSFQGPRPEYDPNDTRMANVYCRL